MIILELIVRWLIRVYQRLFPQPECADDRCKEVCKGYMSARFWDEMEFRSKTDTGTAASGSSYASWILGRGFCDPKGFDIPCDTCGCSQNRHGLVVEVWTPDRLPNGGAVYSEIARREKANKRSLTEAGAADVSRSALNGVQVEEMKVGRGDRVERGRMVAIEHTGRLKSTGAIFDQSTFERPFIFKMGDWTMIPGWEDSLNGMRVGGVRSVTVPSHLAYGPGEVDGIINADLIFQIRVLKVFDQKRGFCSIQ